MLNKHLKLQWVFAALIWILPSIKISGLNSCARIYYWRRYFLGKKHNLLKTVSTIVWNECDGSVLWWVLKRPCVAKLIKTNSAVLFTDFFVQHSMTIVWHNNKPVHILEIIVSYINRWLYRWETACVLWYLKWICWLSCHKFLKSCYGLINGSMVFLGMKQQDFDVTKYETAATCSTVIWYFKPYNWAKRDIWRKRDYLNLLYDNITILHVKFGFWGSQINTNI